MSWEEVKSKLSNARTPQEKQDAAIELSNQIPEEHRDKNLVIMQKGGVHVIKLGALHQAMQNNPVYDLVKKIVSGR